MTDSVSLAAQKLTEAIEEATRKMVASGQLLNEVLQELIRTQNGEGEA